MSNLYRQCHTVTFDTWTELTKQDKMIVKEVATEKYVRLINVRIIKKVRLINVRLIKKFNCSSILAAETPQKIILKIQIHSEVCNNFLITWTIKFRLFLKFRHTIWQTFHEETSRKTEPTVNNTITFSVN